MHIEAQKIGQLIKLLQNEVVPAEGCTEPIALAFAAAKAKELLSVAPDKVDVFVSGNIIKNVKSVIVPNSGDKAGIAVAVAMGVVAGKPDKKLMVISDVSSEELRQVERILESTKIITHKAANELKLYIRIEAYAGSDKAIVELKHGHTNITYLEKNGQVVSEMKDDQTTQFVDDEINVFSVREILAAASTYDTNITKQLFDTIKHYNATIANEGLQNTYGAAIGQSIQKSMSSGFYAKDVRNCSACRAAAGSDARMGGSALPVMTAAGSGNIGLTIALPFIEYASQREISSEALDRALFFAILSTVYIKAKIGRLSAFCGPMCASAGVAGAIGIMNDQVYDVIANAMTNALACVAGTFCDGANSSCATKIASAVYVAYDAIATAMNGHVITKGDGVVGQSIEDTINNISAIAKQGMQKTDDMILDIMIRG